MIRKIGDTAPGTYFFTRSQDHDEETHFVRIPAHVCSMFEARNGDVPLLERRQGTPMTLGQR